MQILLAFLLSLWYDTHVKFECALCLITFKEVGKYGIYLQNLR